MGGQPRTSVPIGGQDIEMRLALTVLMLVAAAAPGIAAAADLSGYVGKYPFDKVAGRDIYHVPGVRQQIVKAFGERRWALLQSYSTAVPIEAATDAEFGRVLVVDQCKPHDCPNSAKILLATDGHLIGGCFVSFGIKSGTVEWASNGWHKHAPTTTLKACGDNPAGIVAKFKAAAPARR